MFNALTSLPFCSLQKSPLPPIGSENVEESVATSESEVDITIAEENTGLYYIHLNHSIGEFFLKTLLIFSGDYLLINLLYYYTLDPLEKPGLKKMDRPDRKRHPKVLKGYRSEPFDVDEKKYEYPTEAKKGWVLN